MLRSLVRRSAPLAWILSSCALMCAASGPALAGEHVPGSGAVPDGVEPAVPAGADPSGCELPDVPDWVDGELPDDFGDAFDDLPDIGRFDPAALHRPSEWAFDDLPDFDDLGGDGFDDVADALGDDGFDWAEFFGGDIPDGELPDDTVGDVVFDPGSLPDPADTPETDDMTEIEKMVVAYLGDDAVADDGTVRVPTTSHSQPAGEVATAGGESTTSGGTSASTDSTGSAEAAATAATPPGGAVAVPPAVRY